MTRHVRRNRLIPLVASLLLGPCLSVAGDSKGHTKEAIAAAQASDEIVRPKPVYRVDPKHPEELYKRGIEGTAVIIATVDMFGSVQDPIIASSTHDEFGLAALLATSEWSFEPATKGGVPIELKVRIPFSFEIAFEHKLNVEMQREVFQELKMPVIPSSQLDHAPQPSFVPALVEYYPEEFKKSGKSAAVSLEFIIDPQGYVINPRVISISTQGFEKAALRAISNIRFKPIKIEGQAVYVSMMMPIHLRE